MFGLRLSAASTAGAMAFAGLMLSAPVALAAHHHHHHYRHSVVVDGGVEVYSEYGNQAVFPNTEDHSSECVNGYRWQRHNNDWYKTEAQDSIPLPCD